MRCCLFLCCAIALPVCAKPVCADLVDIHAISDGYLDESNNVIDNTTTIQVSHDPRIGAVEFDLSALQNATINSASLIINTDGVSGGVNGISYETGIYAYNGNGTIEVGDFDVAGSPDATQTFVGNTMANLDVLVTSLLQTQVDAAAAFIGFTLNQEGSGSYARNYRSSEFNTATTGFNPTLRVNFTLSSTPEPNSAALLSMMVGLGFLGSRRHRRRKNCRSELLAG